MKNIRLKPSLLAMLMLGGAFVSQTAAVSADTMSSTTGSGIKVQVMTHLCNSSIKNIDDFKALEAGRDPIAALANTVLNCPTTGLPGTTASPGTVASPRTTYNFSVTGEHHADQFLSSSGQYMQHKLSEADINKDVNGDGKISSTTALDISHYEFPNVLADNGRIQVIETSRPAGFRFGALRFTPPSLINNNDQQALLAIDDVQGRIQLDLTNDHDKMIMLHVYNFSTGGSGTGTTTPPITGTSTDRDVVISQINALLTQIQNLIAQIRGLLARL